MWLLEVEGSDVFSLEADVIIAAGARLALQNEKDVPLIGAPDSFRIIRCFPVQQGSLNCFNISPTPEIPS